MCRVLEREDLNLFSMQVAVKMFPISYKLYFVGPDSFIIDVIISECQLLFNRLM